MEIKINLLSGESSILEAKRVELKSRHLPFMPPLNPLQFAKIIKGKFSLEKS